MTEPPVRPGDSDGERRDGWAWCLVCEQWYPRGTAHYERQPAEYPLPPKVYKLGAVPYIRADLVKEFFSRFDGVRGDLFKAESELRHLLSRLDKNAL